MPVNLYPAPFSRVHQGPIIVNPPAMSMGPMGPGIGPATMPMPGPMGTMPPAMMQQSMAMGNPTLGPVSMDGTPRPIGSVLTNGVANPYIQHNALSTAFEQPAYNTSYTNLPVSDPRFVPSMLPKGHSGDYGGGAGPKEPDHTLQPGPGGYGGTINVLHPSLSQSQYQAQAIRQSMQSQSQSQRYHQSSTLNSPSSQRYCAECQAASQHHHHGSSSGRMARSSHTRPLAETYTSAPSPYRHDAEPRAANSHSKQNRSQYLSPSMASDSTSRDRRPNDVRHPSPLGRHRSPLGRDGDPWPDRELSDQLHGLRRRRSSDATVQPQPRRASDASEVGRLRISALRIEEEGDTRGRRHRSATPQNDRLEAQGERPRHSTELEDDFQRLQHSQMLGSGRYPDFATSQREASRQSQHSRRSHGDDPSHPQKYNTTPRQREPEPSRSSRLTSRPILEPIRTTYPNSTLDPRGLDIEPQPPGEMWPLPERQVSPSRQHRAIYLGHQPAGLNSSSRLRPQWRDGDYSRD